MSETLSVVQSVTESGASDSMTEKQGILVDQATTTKHSLLEMLKLDVEQQLKKDDPMPNMYALVREQFEDQLFAVVLDYTKNNQVKAAKLLGIARGTLRTRLAIIKKRRLKKIEEAMSGTPAKNDLLEGAIRQDIEQYLAIVEDSPPNNLYVLVREKCEKPLLEAVMHHTSNNQVRAAKVLGIARGTLRTLLKKHGML